MWVMQSSHWNWGPADGWHRMVMLFIVLLHRPLSLKRCLWTRIKAPLMGQKVVMLEKWKSFTCNNVLHTTNVSTSLPDRRCWMWAMWPSNRDRGPAHGSWNGFGWERKPLTNSRFIYISSRPLLSGVAHVVSELGSRPSSWARKLWCWRNGSRSPATTCFTFGRSSLRTSRCSGAKSSFQNSAQDQWITLVSSCFELGFKLWSNRPKLPVIIRERNHTLSW